MMAAEISSNQDEFAGHMTLEEFHERIQFNSDEREDIQKKTFTKWINSHLVKREKAEVVDLFADFCNGKSLLALLEILSGSHLNPEKGRMRVHHLNNVNRAVQYLTDKCQIRLVNISSDDVVNGNAKLILGLVWSIIYHWQVKKAMSSLPPSGRDGTSSSAGGSAGGQDGFEKTLLSWCRSTTQGYNKVNVTNFTSSWSDGFAFNALIHGHRPDLFDYDELIAVNDPEYSLLHAFQIANSNFSIAKLLDPEDMIRPDKKSVLMYLTCLYEALHQNPPANQDSELNQSANQTQSNDQQPITAAQGHVTTSSQSTYRIALDTITQPITATSSSYLPAEQAQPKQNYNSGLESPQVPTKVARLNAQAPEQPSRLTPSDIASGPDAHSDATSMTSASGVSSLPDLQSFNSLLEQALTWLLDAKERFNKMSPVAEDVEEVKAQFHEHEKYMMDLTQYQTNVGTLLTKGNTLLQAGDLTTPQEQEVKGQVDLLNQEWEDLRVGAMERQTSLQQSLMELQQDQLSELGTWLANMESKIADFNTKIQCIETIEGVRRCVEEHQMLQESLEKQQDKVNSLQNMVVIVEDGVQDTAYQTMEKQLEELGNRWIAVCKWIEDQWLHLQDVDVKWGSYHANADMFNKWLDNQEVLLGRMRLSDVSDPQILLNQVQRLKAIEGEMDEQMSRYDELNNVGQALISYLPSFPQTAEKIQLRLEEYKDRWDRLVQQMEQQSKVIAESGLNPEEILAAAHKQKGDVTEQFDEGANKISEWLDKTANTLDLQGSENSGLSLDEQLVLLDDITDGTAALQSIVSHIQHLTEHHSKELGEKRVINQKKIHQEWHNVCSQCQQRRVDVEQEILHKQLFNEESALREILKSYSKWIDSASDTNVDAIELGKQCEQCRVKLKAMKHQQDRLDKLNSARHSKCILNDAHLAENITNLYTDWSSVYQRIEDRMRHLSENLTQAPPRKYLDATEALMKWLTEAEEILLENVCITDITTMEKNITLYQDLQKAIHDHVADVEYVNKTGEDLVKRSSVASSSSDQTARAPDQTSVLQLQLSSLNARWRAISDNIQEKLSQLAEGIEQLKLFETKVNGLSRWMTDMENFLEAEQPAFGDTDVIQAQIAQSDGALADIDTLQSVVDEINTTGEILVSGSEEEFGVELRRELERMNERWAQINQISQQQNKQLKEALGKSEKLLTTITSVSEFLTDFDSKVTEKLCFTTKHDLDTSCNKIKTLENEMEKRKADLDMVHALSDELMEKTRQDSLPRLLNRLKHIDLKWKHVSERLAARQEECSDVSTRYSDFLSLVQSDNSFISQLEVRLNKGDNQEVDAEDMAAEMDELEQLLEDQDKQSPQALTQLSVWFQENNILIEETKLVQSELVTKRETVVEQASVRVKTLDRASQKSEDTELKLSEMETWMDEVNSLFRDWNDQDLLAGELPEDHKTLQEEFSEKDSFLKSIEVQIKDFRSLGKTQAADRLEKKLEMIKEDYKIAQQNFLKWQRPVDFDPKLRRTQQQLHEIDDKIYLIEIFEEDPDHVQIKLEQCAKFYGTMSEIKSEVEYVIKTGRQLVEKKQVDFPRRVNQTLDALKSLYNRLGSQISQARKDLDKALKISKVIAKNVHKVTELIESTEEKLQTEIGDLAEETIWVQERESEFERVHPTLSSITTLHGQFQEFADESALDEAKENLETLKERWQTVIQALAARQRQIQAQQSNSDADLEMFKVKAKQLLLQLQALRAMLDRPDQLQKLQAELQSLKSDVTDINQSAVEISSKGAKYRDQIEPTINNINSAYKILTNQAQVESEVIEPDFVTVQHTAVTMDTNEPITSPAHRGDEAADLFDQLSTAVKNNRNRYEVATLFAQCEAREDKLSEGDKQAFNQLQSSWNSKRSSTVIIWQSYELHWAQMSLKLTQLEYKLDMASTDTSLLQEIEDEIARRQVEINALNEQAEDLTEQDVPPIEQRLLQLNQRWVGVRSRVANFKPASGSIEDNITPTNGTSVNVEMSPPTKQKYEYAVINKNRKNQGNVVTTVTADVRIDSPVTMRKDMSLDLHSPVSPTNNNSLFVVTPRDESAMSSPSKSSSSTPGSGVDVDTISLGDELSESTASKRSICTDLDEAARQSSDSLSKPSFATSLDQRLSVGSADEAVQGDVRTLLSRVGILQQQLNNSGIELDSYTHENFNSSQDLLKSVSASMEVLEHDIVQAQASLKLHSGSPSVSVTESMDRLDEAWNHLNSTYRALQSNFDEALTLWTQFHALLKVITAWLDSTEKSLKRTRDKSGELIVESAKNIQKELEESMTQHQAIIHNLARTAIPLASKLQPSDAQRITEKVAKVTNRWRDVTVDIRARKPRLDSMSDAGKCLDVMDDLSFWLDETEIIITTSPNYTDEQSLREALEKVKDRSNEVPYKKEALEFVSRSARDLWSLPELKPEDKEKIGRDMQRVSDKWHKIVGSISNHEKHLEISLQTLHDLLFEIGKLNAELWQAIQDLAPRMSDEANAEMSEMYPHDQSVSIETLSIWYREILLLYKRHSVIISPELESHFRQLNIRWSAIREKTILPRSGSDSSIEETLATAAEFEDIFEEPRQSIFLENSVHSAHIAPVLASAPNAGSSYDEDCPPPPPRKESLQQPAMHAKPMPVLVAGQPLNREETLSLLSNRLDLLNRTVSNRRVEVTDYAQIQDSETKVNKLTVAVQEILRQLDPYTEADEQVSGLRTECTKCQIRSISRGNELRQLLIDSHKYGDKMAQIDSWLTQLENKVEERRKQAIGDAVEVVDKQIQQHVALEMEMKSWKDNFAILNQMTEDLLSNYPHEDHSNLRLNSESLAVRCNSIQLFVAERNSDLNTHRTLLQDYNSALDNFVSWLANQESSADILLEEIKQNDPMRSSTWAARSKDLQTQIDSHQRQYELLNVAGKKISERGDNSNPATPDGTLPGAAGAMDTQALKQRLDEMNERWSQLRAKTVQIRCRLESSMDQWSDLIEKIRLLIDYLTSRENELIAARPVAGNLAALKNQQTAHQTWKSRLDSKTSDFEHALSTGRFYLEREGADRRLSSASCDSRIMDELTIESSEAKTVIKNIRRHIRLLNQKWLELHNKSDRWSNQLTACDKNLENINNLINLASRHLNEIDTNMQSWKNVHDYPVADLPRQLTSVRAMRRRNEEASEVLNKTNALVKAHEDTEAPIDNIIKHNIAQLQNRHKSYESDLSQRFTQLVGLNRSLVPDIEELLKDSVSRPYERSTTPSGVPYYINHDRKTTQWDHPRMVSLLAQLPSFNTTKFSAYRTAQKLRKMQKALGLNLIRLKDVIRCCQEQRIIPSVTGDELIDVNSIISCLRDMFEHLADDRHASSVNVPLSIDLTLNWLLNVYDLGRQGQVSSVSFQVGLVIMCRGAAEDKFNYLLSCLSDKQGLIEESKLSLLISNCVQIPRQLGELGSFGGANIEPSVQSCLEQANGSNAVTARQFMDWLALEPQSMVWLPVFHRLATSESCRHQAKCSLCKTTPIIGLRYRCLRCFNFNLCQTCFFSGKKGKSHKLNHPMKEYFCASTSNDDMKDLSSPMRKKYSSGRYIKKHNPKGYLPLTKLGDGESTFSRESLSNMSDTGTPVSSPPSIHLQYETGGSVSSHDATNSHDRSHDTASTLPRTDDSNIHRDIERYAHTLDRLERGNRNNGNSNILLNGNEPIPHTSTAAVPSNTQTKLPAKAAAVPKTIEMKPETREDNSKRPTVNGDNIDNDEHKIIERYCSSLSDSPVPKTNGKAPVPSAEPRIEVSSVESPLRSPMQIVMSLEDNQKTELEAMIKDLEDENRNLQTEYQMLQAERDRQAAPPTMNGDRQAEMLAEAKLLRQHKGRLETRMKILEDHNKQLEAQLRRLRHLLEQPSEPGAVHTSSPQASSSSSPLRVKKLPPTYDRQTSENDSTSSLSSNTQRTPKLHGSIGELFQMAGQVGKAVNHLVSVVSDQPSSS